MLACSGMIEPIKAQKLELVKEESQLSNGVHSHIFGKGWSNHVFQNLQSGTKQMETEERLVDEVSISHAWKRACMSYWAARQKIMHHGTFSLSRARRVIIFTASPATNEIISTRICPSAFAQTTLSRESIKYRTHELFWLRPPSKTQQTPPKN